jgi:hypothetical protein
MPVVIDRSHLRAAAAGNRRAKRGSRGSSTDRAQVQPWQVAVAVTGLVLFLVYMAWATQLLA